MVTGANFLRFTMYFLQLQKDNPQIFPMFFVYLPIAGTRLFNEIVESGMWKEPETMEEWVDMDSTQWIHTKENWNKKSIRHELSTIMMSSLFCSKSAKVKFGTLLGKAIFTFYHPIAYLRFKFKFFKFPIESRILTWYQLN